MLAMIEVDENTCIAPAYVVHLVAARDYRPQRWGVWVTYVGGRVFRPAEKDTEESARELLRTWRHLINGEA